MSKMLGPFSFCQKLSKYGKRTHTSQHLDLIKGHLQCKCDSKSQANGCLVVHVVLTSSFCMLVSRSSKRAGSGCDSGCGCSDQVCQAEGSSCKLGASRAQADDVSATALLWPSWARYVRSCHPCAAEGNCFKSCCRSKAGFRDGH